MFFTASAFVYAERRGLLIIFPDNMQQGWKKWEAQVFILFSLIFQVVLSLLGHRRKYMGKRARMRFIVWSAYVLADWIAAVALGVLSQDTLGQQQQNDCGSNPKPTQIGDQTSMQQLMSFWAPFLLLHLGGPDTITAYSLQDNDLWSRHLVALVIQTGLASYVLLVSLPGSTWLPTLSILIFFAGLIKLVERILALRSATQDNIRDSMLTPPDPGPNYAKFMEEFTLKKAVGFHVEANVVREHTIPIENGNSHPSSRDPKGLAIVAHDRFQRFKLLFVDLILSFQDRDSSQSYFRSLTAEQAFYVVEVELGFAFDMFHTKAPIVYSKRGCISRLVTFSFSFVAFILFVLLCEKDKYHIMNLLLTYLLLVVAILAEIYGFFSQMSSDWTLYWLYKHEKIREYLNGPVGLRLASKRRWSYSMAQYNLMSFCLEEKPALCFHVQKLLGLVEFREKHRYKTYEDLSPDLKDSIFNQFKKFIGNSESGPPAICTRRDILALREHLPDCTSEEIEFDQSLLMWHIATDLCYYWDEDDDNSSDIRLKTSEDMQGKKKTCRESKQLSDYMLYLLVLNPFMLPIGIGLIRFRDTCAEAKEFFNDRRLGNGRVEACKKLRRVNTEVPPVKVKGDRSKSVLFDACRLAKGLQSVDRDEKWDVISNVWVEMLAYAATHCRGNHHAQQLRKGGELLTHVWLLMAHLGITQQFQIYQGHARAKLVAK